MDSHSILDRALRDGWHSIAAVDLLAVMLATDANDLDAAASRAHEMYRELGGLYSLLDIDRDRLRSRMGCGEFEVCRAMAVLELGNRASRSGKGPTADFTHPADVWDRFKRLRREKKEHVVALFLDAKNGLICERTLHIGTLSMSLVGPREVFREAVREGASALILAHNHPSGDPEPSPEDIELTQKLEELGRMLDVAVLDHVILGRDSYVSLRDRGVLGNAQPARPSLAATQRNPA